MFVGRDPLSSATRRRICEHVTKQPGLHLRAIARGVDLDTNHTKYHLTYLEQHGLVSSERVHGYWAFFPSDSTMAAELGDLDPNEKAQLFLVRKEVPRRVVNRLIEVKEANHKVLQEAAGVSASTLYYHLRRMADKEVVISRKQGPARLWRLKTPELSKRLLEVSSTTEWLTNEPRAEPLQEEAPVETVEAPAQPQGQTIDPEARWKRQPTVVETRKIGGA